MKTKIIHKRYHASEGGFVLIAALMAVMIMMAVGFFSLTVTSQDIRISARLVGDRKAFSAAESGLHWLTVSFSPGMPAVSNEQVDPTNDPTVRYSTTVPAINQIMPTVPKTRSSEYNQLVYNSRVTGRDTSFDSNVVLEIGLGHGNVPRDTGYR